MDLNKRILCNLIMEREIAYAKRELNKRANLPHNILDTRIKAIEVAIEEVKKKIASA